MAGWLLAISRDAELTRSLARLLMRQGGQDQLWTVDSPVQARRGLGDRASLPSTILIDELLLREEPLVSVAEEFSWYAPLVLIARPDQQAHMASLIAEGNADFVPRSDYYIPLATALIERNLRWTREFGNRHRQLQAPAAVPTPGKPSPSESTESDSSAEALRMLGVIIDTLEQTLSERAHLPDGVSQRLERVTDLTFDLKDSLRLLAGGENRKDSGQHGTETPDPR